MLRGVSQFNYNVCYREWEEDQLLLSCKGTSIRQRKVRLELIKVLYRDDK